MCAGAPPPSLATMTASLLGHLLEAQPATRDHAGVDRAAGSVADDASGLLERTSELSQLHESAAEAATACCGRLALVCGEAGIGKSALLRRFRRTLPGRFTVIWGACDPLFAPRPLGPLLEPAQVLGGELAECLAGEVSPYDVARALLAGLSSQSPSVLILDDLQWADEATLDVVRLLARQLEPAATLVVLSFRDDCLHRTHPLGLVLGELPPDVVCARLELGGLSSSAVCDLARGTSVDADLLHQRTGGNPFFVTEALAGGGEVVPATVREAVLARIGRLSEPAIELLDAVSVVPQRSEVWLLEAMCGGDLRALEECLHSGVLRVDGNGVVFRHELARLAVAESLRPDLAIALHRRALEALSTHELGLADLARLSHHAEAAGDAAAVLRYAPAAGEQAASMGAPREAERQYIRALRFARHLTPEQRAPLQQRLAEHAYLGDLRADAADHLSEAIETYRQAGDLIRQGHALRWHARLLGCIGRTPEAAADIQEAIRVLEQAAPGRDLVLARSSYASIRTDDDVAEAIELAERATALAEQLGDPELLTSALNNLGMAQLFQADEAGCAALERSLEIAIAHRLAMDAGRAYINLGCGLRAIGRWRDALALAESGIEYSREHGLEAWVRCLLGIQAQAQLALGQWDLAAATASRLFAKPDDPIVEARFDARVALALVRARRGDPGAHALLDEAHEIANDGAPFELIAEVAAARAELAWLEGRADAVAEETDEVYPRSQQVGHWAWAGELAVWRRRAGIDDELPSGPLTEHHRYLLAGDGRAAATVLRDNGCPYGAALALADTGGPIELREALDELRALGARPAAARVVRRLRELGERSVPSGPRPRTRANVALLTPRELQVLPLLVEGLRNADIADRLVISTKTVDHHVSSILGKLDVRTRGQAAMAAARLGIIDN